ncbi:STAS domain-containing protein [Streptomyces rimosus]|uniref:STAS domain-containing protein n=1 Tax=Streptomyces rimosus TaxID=1927 RepID=UPI0004BFE857|nr:STAS domain-containing protein [Streptomyces rimosus]
MAFQAYLGFSGGTVLLTMVGAVTDENVPVLRSLVDRAVARGPRRLVVRAEELTSITPGGVRCLALAQQRLSARADVLVDGARPAIREALRQGGLEPTVAFVDQLPPFPREDGAG